MAWEDELFSFLDDLESQAEALYDEERAAEVADRSRAEYASVTLASRLMASLDTEVRLTVSGVGVLTGHLARVSEGWCLVQSRGQDWIVPWPAVVAVAGTSARSVPEVAWSPVTRLGLGSALRRLATAERTCVLHLRDGSRHEGVFRRVGADFAELAQPSDRVVLVAFAALAAVASAD